LGGNLRGRAIKQIEVHLAACPSCLDELVAVQKAMGQRTKQFLESS
jgi:hypothetical protein